MKKCPYCFEVLPEVSEKCPHCAQFFIDPLIESEFKSLDKKNCVFCGKKILKEAKICKYCRKWNDEVGWAAADVE